MNKEKFETWRENQKEKSESSKHSLAIFVSTIFTLLVGSFVAFSWYTVFTSQNVQNINIALNATSTKENTTLENNSYLKKVTNFTQKVVNKVNKIYKKTTTN